MALRILWVSNSPLTGTGYGCQTRITVPLLKALNHEMSICANYGIAGSQIRWQGIQILPTAGEDWGQSIVGSHAAAVKADLVISLCDAFVLDPAGFNPPCKIAMWYPVDHEPLADPIYNPISKAVARIAMSRFGEQMTKDRGLVCHYIPHSIDTIKTFVPGKRTEARDRLRLPQDRFIVLMVAANKGFPSRKAIPAQIEAFARFHKEHPDSLLYLHTLTGHACTTQAVDVIELIHALHLESAVLVSYPYTTIIGNSDEHMRDLYQSADVLLHASMGEGFGLAGLEAQACGCPVITGDWTAMSELCFGGWMVKKQEAERFWTPIGSWQYLPHIDAIVDRLNQAYEVNFKDAVKWQEIKKQAREGARGYEMTDVIPRYWHPFLTEMEAKLKA